MSNKTAEIPVSVTDPEIAAFVEQLHRDSRDGILSCVAIVSVRNDGTSARFLHGAANSVQLVGDLEFLKASILHQRMQEAGAAAAEDRPAYVC